MPRIALLLLACLLPVLVRSEPANMLRDHASPYLAMHGSDPVQWQDWGPGALQRARAENKPLFISSGYFACHWCHVMQRESYRDASIAALLNRHFVPVKVDRELHPALDAYLIDFVERTRGTAGWPLNVFLTPEGHPLIGLTYAPPEDFRRLLVRLAGAWGNESERLSDMARAAAEAMTGSAARAPTPAAPDPAALRAALRTQSLELADELLGGFGHQSRFPMAPQLGVLIALQAQDPDPRLGAFLRLTLTQMARQGMHDLLAGGFFRYTVDPDWRTPHFEKMLYDQALLAALYLRAAQALDEPALLPVARGTLDFTLAQMAGPDGAFIASLSAVDGAGTEGGAYLWREADLDRLLDRRERELVALAWAMQGVPEHDAGYLPRLQLSPAAAARELGLDPAEAAAALERARAKLLLSRAGRDLPRDGKVLAAWNGLMLSALSAAARTFGEPYRAAGQRLRDHLVRHAWDGRRLSRAREGAADLGAAGLEDYALVARGLADWADTADSREDRALALRLVRLAWQLFYQDGWRLGADRLLPAQPAAPALPDGPLPAPSAVLIGLTLELAEPGRDGDLLALARAALALGQAAAAQQPFTYAGTAWLMAQGEAPSEGGVVPSAAAVGDVPEPDRAVGPGHERSAPR